MKATNTTKTAPTLMERFSPRKARIANLGSLYSQVIELRRYGYSYKKIHNILGNVSQNYCSAICLTYNAIATDDYGVFYTNGSVGNYRYIIPWAAQKLGKDVETAKKKALEQRLRRDVDLRNGTFKREVPTSAIQMPNDEGSNSITPSLMEELNENLTFFRKLISGETLMLATHG